MPPERKPCANGCKRPVVAGEKYCRICRDHVIRKLESARYLDPEEDRRARRAAQSAGRREERV